MGTITIKYIDDDGDGNIDASVNVYDYRGDVNIFALTVGGGLANIGNSNFTLQFIDP